MHWIERPQNKYHPFQYCIFIHFLFFQWKSEFNCNNLQNPGTIPKQIPPISKLPFSFHFTSFNAKKNKKNLTAKIYKPHELCIDICLFLSFLMEFKKHTSAFRSSDLGEGKCSWISQMGSERRRNVRNQLLRSWKWDEVMTPETGKAKPLFFIHRDNIRLFPRF